MKDRQVELTPAPLRIPFISAFLHCVSMTVIVFLRSGFGYAYLRPKSVFFAFSWAFALFAIFSWHEKEVWSQTWFATFYGAATVTLYWLHLAIALLSELWGKAKHDNHSGTPHIFRISKMQDNEALRFAMKWQIWGEPLLVLIGGLVLRWPFGERFLSTWLLITAPCLCAKECLNFWSLIRHKKRYKDSIEDAQDTLDHDDPIPPDETPATARKDRVRRFRNSAP